MEHHDPSRRQYARQPYTAQQAPPALAPTSGQYATPAGSGRYRQPAFMQESPTTPGSAARGGSDLQQAYGFGPNAQYGSASAMQPSILQYGQDMPTPEPQRQQTQSYQQYGSHVVYGMAQPHGAQTPYDPVTQYRSRTNTATEALGSHFGVPQTGQYYIPRQPTQTNTSAAEMSSHNLLPQYAQPEAYPQPGSANPQPYAAAMMDPGQAAQYQAYPQQPQYPPVPQQPTFDQGADRYNDQIRTIFTLAHDGSLRHIDNLLLDAATYLIGNAENFGLTRDDENLHADRLRLWAEFNTAWLVTLQRQFDMAEEMNQTGFPLRDPHSLLSAASLERLGNELVRLCDGVETQGLTDYQLGVAEDEIIELLLRCQAVLEPADDRFGEGGPYAMASASNTRRAR